jgi:pyridoxal 5'-phosphate synthase pdxT subunit
VRVNRNHFGRQIESFQADLELPFLSTARPEDDFSRNGPGGHQLDGEEDDRKPFHAIFIRAPIVEKILPSVNGVQEGEARVEGTVVAPSRVAVEERLSRAPVEILATLPGRAAKLGDGKAKADVEAEAGDIVAVKQGNVFGTSFHPELTGDERIHVWWLGEVVRAFEERKGL